MERGRIIVNNIDYTGSFVTPNPSEPPTKDLNTLEIEGEVFNIAGGGGGGTNLIVDAQIYSLEEKQVGVWVDGRPLYQKTFIRNITLSGGSWVTTGDSILNGKAIDAEVTAIDQSSDTVPVWCEIGADGHIELLNIRGSGFVTITHYTVRYFKTTDTAGSGGFQAYGFTPVIYSTEEREIGVWTDNKPLYQKTWILSNEVLVNSNGITISEIDASMIEHLIGCNGGYQSLSNTKSIPIMVWKYNNTWYYGSSINAYVDTITLLYTKTTDTAGSGSYNTLGVPNVHYTTDEQVIGTWFGETLYEKTINCNFRTTTSSTIITSIADFSNIKCFISAMGYQTSVSGEEGTFPIAIWKYDNNVYQRCIEDAIIDKLTIQYTKTTD